MERGRKKGGEREEEKGAYTCTNTWLILPAEK